MTEIALFHYLGIPVSQLLRTPPFSGWVASRSIEQALPNKEVWYEFEGHGVEVICDEADLVRSIFLHRGDGEAEALSPVPFSTRRQEILRLYGPPSASGAASRLPVLGDQGAWDRFSLPGGLLHIQYRLDRDGIELVTLMHPAAAP